MWMSNPVRVSLTEDLTRYDSRLVPGATGVLVPFWTTGAWGTNPHFGAVRFDNGGPTIDLVLDRLQFHYDQEDINDINAKMDRNEAILEKTIRNVRVTKVNGKFRRLTYEFSPEDDGLYVTTGTEFDKDAVRLLELFKKWGTKVTAVG